MTDPSLYEGFGTRIALRAVNAAADLAQLHPDVWFMNAGAFSCTEAKAIYEFLATWRCVDDAKHFLATHVFGDSEDEDELADHYEAEPWLAEWSRMPTWQVPEERQCTGSDPEDSFVGLEHAGDVCPVHEDLSDSACLRAIQVRVEKACEDLLTTPTDADELFEIVRGADPDFPNVPHKLWTLYQESDITHAYLACLIEDRLGR